MSEKLDDLLEHLPPIAIGSRVSMPRETYERVRAAITELAAAEERGRLRGVEEGFRRGVESSAQYLKASEPLRLAMHRALSDRAALAPRDSGPAIPSVASQGCPECSKPQPGDLGMGSIEARQLRCPHGKYTPRDSAPGDCPIVGCQIVGKHDHPIGGPAEARK